MRPFPLCAVLALGGCGPLLDGDVALVGVSSNQLDVSAAQLRVDQLLLDDCEGSLTVVTIGGDTDLLSAAPLPRRLPGGTWCGMSVRFAAAEGLALTGTTSGGSAVDAALAPTLVDVDTGSFVVDADEFVLVLDIDVLVDPAAVDDGAPGSFGVGDAEARAWEARLPDALWFGRVETASTTVYVDLWPWPDVVFDGGYAGGGAPSGGCSGGVWFDLDGDGIPDDEDDDDNDGIPDSQDADADGDGIDDAIDPDRDGDGVADVDDPDGGAGETPGGGRNDGDTRSGGGGCSGDGGGCGGGGGGGGCDGGGAGCACEASTCSTLGFVPPGLLAVFGIIGLRRRRYVGTGESTRSGHGLAAEAALPPPAHEADQAQ